jgi:hypothetical protein
MGFDLRQNLVSEHLFIGNYGKPHFFAFLDGDMPIDFAIFAESFVIYLKRFTLVFVF